MRTSGHGWRTEQSGTLFMERGAAGMLRGQVHRMQPRWQSDAYGSWNPVAMLVGTGGWGLFIATPWGQIDLTREDQGLFTPRVPADPDSMRQDHDN